MEVKIEIPGAVICQRTDFDDATGIGKISVEYVSLSAGVDTAPLTTTDADGIQETVSASDMIEKTRTQANYFLFPLCGGI